jgi:hypothetical protein
MCWRSHERDGTDYADATFDEIVDATGKVVLPGASARA